MTDQPETGTPTNPPPTPQPEPVATPASPQDVDAAAEILAARTTAHHRAVELAAYRTAVAAGADADALLDSRTFVREVRDLDPSSTDFADKVKSIIKTRQGNPVTDTTTTQPDAGKATDTTTAPAAGQDPDKKPDTGDADLRAELEKVRAEAEKWKHFSRQHEDTSKATKKQLDDQQRVLKLLAEKAGIALEEGAPDPEKLTADLAQARADARQKAVELAVYRTAGKHDGDADALLDSRTFAKAVEGLDPGADDFTTKVGEAIAAAVKADSRYKAQPAKQEPATDPEGAPGEEKRKEAEPGKEQPKPRLPRSGGEFGGAPGGNRQWTEADVENASPAEVSQAMEQGLLQDLGFGATKTR